MAESTAHATAVVLTGEQYEELEFWYPVLRFREAGIACTVVGIDGAAPYYGRVQYPVAPDAAPAAAPASPGVVVVPSIHGYVWGTLPPAAGEFLRTAAASGAILAAVGTGVAVLADAGLLEGVTVSCANDSLAGLVEGAGGKISAERVTRSASVLTARSVEDVTELVRSVIGQDI